VSAGGGAQKWPSLVAWAVAAAAMCSKGPDRRAVIRARIQRSAALARAVNAIRLVPGNRRGVRHGIDSICI